MEYWKGKIESGTIMSPHLLLGRVSATIEDHAVASTEASIVGTFPEFYLG